MTPDYTHYFSESMHFIRTTLLLIHLTHSSSGGSSSTTTHVGLHGAIYLSSPKTKTLYKEPHVKWTTINKSNFKIPSLEAKLLDNLEKAYTTYEKYVETTLKEGNFQTTFSGEYVTKLDKTYVTAALEKCRTLHGRLLDITSQENVDITKTLLGDEEKKIWQSQVQTPAHTYFLSKGEPLPANFNETAITPQGVLEECPIFDLEKMGFYQVDCLTQLPSICLSKFPRGHMTLTSLTLKKIKKVKQATTSYFSNLEKSLLDLPISKPSSPTDIDNVMITPWDDRLTELSGKLNQLSHNKEFVNTVLARALRYTTDVKENTKRISRPDFFTEQQMLTATDDKKTSKIVNIKLYGTTDSKIALKLTLQEKDKTWKSYKAQPLIVLGKTANIHNRIYVNQDETACKFATSPPTLTIQLKDDLCCMKHLLKSDNICRTNNATNKHNFYAALPNNNKEEYLVVSHDKVTVNSSCHTTPAVLEGGSYKFSSETDSSDCETSVANTDILLKGALKVLKYSSKGWVEIAKQLWNDGNVSPTPESSNNPEDTDNQNETGKWSSTSTYLLLGLCLMSILVILTIIFIVVLTWKNRNNPQRRPSHLPTTSPPRDSVNRVDIPLKPILKPARCSSTRSSTSSSSSSTDSE